MKKYILIVSLTICGLQAMCPGLGPDRTKTPSPVLTQDPSYRPYTGDFHSWWCTPDYFAELTRQNEKKQNITAAKAYLIELIQKINTSSESDQQENKITFKELTDTPVENVSNSPEKFVNSLSSQKLLLIQKKITQNKSDTESEPQKQ